MNECYTITEYAKAILGLHWSSLTESQKDAVGEQYELWLDEQN